MPRATIAASLHKRFAEKTPLISYASPDDPLHRHILIRAFESATGQPKLQRIYDDYMRQVRVREDDNFWRSAVDRLGVDVRFDARRAAAVPAKGPVILIANHPFGVLDGIAAGYILSHVRPDFRVMAHAALGRAEPLKPYLIPVEFEPGKMAVRNNVAAQRAALRYLKDGGAIIVFPAGAVSTAPKVVGRAVDLPWKPFAAKLIQASGATVVPLFFEGQNGLMFHFVSRFSASIREALLLREVAKRMGGAISAHIGDPIPAAETAPAAVGRDALLDRLRAVVEGLDPGAGGRFGRH
jgi:putative hemolysin